VFTKGIQSTVYSLPIATSMCRTSIKACKLSLLRHQMQMAKSSRRRRCLPIAPSSPWRARKPYFSHIHVLIPRRFFSEPIFIRTVQEFTPPWAHMNVPGRQIAKDTTTSSSAVVPPPAADQGIPEERPLTIQDKIERRYTTKSHRS
jgi:hypothetical protein